ncbi:MAG: hypothetical protein HGA39_05695 [Coriobacteriia bacterium]|nr:hypothetical protein [Coriobacteriia bacterium]
MGNSLRRLVPALLVVLALSLTGCADRQQPSISVQPSALGSTTATTSPSAGSPSAEEAATSPSAGLSAQDAQSLDAQLAAIQKQLDSLSMPSDADLGDIEAGLY